MSLRVHSKSQLREGVEQAPGFVSTAEHRNKNIDIEDSPLFPYFYHRHITNSPHSIPGDTVAAATAEGMGH